MSVSLSQYWAQLDALGYLVAYSLLLMSLLSWYLILSKAWFMKRTRKSARYLPAFWLAPNLEQGSQELKDLDKENVFSGLLQHAQGAHAQHQGSANLSSYSAFEDVLTRVLRTEMNAVTVRLESGLTLLASIGATAPFVGLLGTVWGIYHALSSISGAAAVQLDLIAGPVGEALVMTALGLIVAIPAVLAFNAFNRINRITFAELDGFAYDLNAHFSKLALEGSKPNSKTSPISGSAN
jgi:biopolymer transport protein ExbB